MAGRTTRRISDAVRQAIVKDAERTIGTPEGSVRKVAARHGVSDGTVRRIVKEQNGEASFGTPATRAKMQNAIDATIQTFAQRRTALAEAALREAERAIRDMNADTWKAFSFGGKDNTFTAVKLDFVPTADRRNLTIIFGTMLDKHKMLDLYDSDARDADAVTAWIRDLSGRGKPDEV